MLTFQQKDHAASASTVLKMFGLERLVQTLNGEGVHSLGNIITMDMVLHQTSNTSSCGWSLPPQ